MALQFEVETLDGIDEVLQGLYQKHGEKYRLKVEGIDPADELKEALRKEREERAEAKRKLAEFEKQQDEGERKRLEERQEFEQLYKTEAEAKGKLSKELDDLRASIANEKRSTAALKIAGSLTKDEKRSSLLVKQALQFIHHTPEGVKINGPDGEAWDTSKLSEYLKAEYPFLVDGSQASGGGANGSNGSGATLKKFNEYSGAELSEIRQRDPQLYDRMRTEFYNH